MLAGFAPELVADIRLEAVSVFIGIRTWANDLKGRKIRVNALSPGFTRTPIQENSLKMDEAQIAALRDYAAQAVPLGYMAEPEEIASAALFLASSDARYVNGVELTADGGFSQI